jgi:hypothetical protein
VRIWLGAALALALAALGWAGHRSAYQSGHEAGSAAVRAEWYLERAKAAEAAREAEALIYARHQEVERGLTDKLDDADRRGRELARRLRDARAAFGVPAACPGAAAADGAPGEPGDARAIDEAFIAHLGACERDAERLAELQRLTED